MNFFVYGVRAVNDKSIVQIFFEFIIGIILMMPLSIFNSDNIVWIFIMKLFYSFGVILSMNKLMSLIYRVISYIFRENMLLYQKSYGMLYVMFICLGVVVWNLFPSYFSKGYLAAEIIAYVLTAFWLLLDICTTKHYWYIISLFEMLDFEIEKHKIYVSEYKEMISDISNRKDEIVKKLEPYFPKKLFGDPLKELKKNIDISHIDKYLQKIPSFQGAYKGIDGFLHGQASIYEFENAIDNYLGNLADDEQWMDSEKHIYDGYVSEMEKIVDNIQESKKRVDTLEELGFDPSVYQKILRGDIVDAGNNRKRIQQLWKMNKKVNKLRRKNYGR